MKQCTKREGLYPRHPLTPHPPQKKKESKVWQGRRDAAGPVRWFQTPALPQRKKFGRIRQSSSGYGLQCVNVGAEPAAGLNASVFMSGYVCVGVHVRSQLQAECQGNPKPPSLSSCLIPHSFFSLLCHLPLSSSSLSLPSGFGEQTSDRSAPTAQP